MFNLYQTADYKTIRPLIITMLFGLFTVLLTPPTFAEGGHTFRLYPYRPSQLSPDAYFVYDSAQAGTVMQDAVLVVNPSSEPVHLSLYAAKAVTGSTGGIAIGANLGEEATDTGSWIQLDTNEVTLPATPPSAPDEPKQVSSLPVGFTLNIPDNVPPGEYVATIVAQPVETAEGEEDNGPVGIRFIPRVATSILITVPGPEPLQSKLDITSLNTETDSSQEIIAELHNSGNDGIPKTTGNLTIRDTNGTEVQQVPLQLGYFIAGDKLTYRANLDSPLEPGEYDITLSLAYGDQLVEQTTRLPFGVTESPPPPPEPEDQSSSPESEDFTIWIIAAAASIVGVLLLLIIIVWRQLRRSSHAQQANSYS